MGEYRLVCDSCKSNRAKIGVRESTLLPGVKLFMCEVCVASGFEPRWIIVLSAASNGLNGLLTSFISKRKYIGKTITAEEILVL